MKTRLPLIRCGLLLLLGYNALAHGQMEGGMGRPEGGRPHNPYGRELLAYRAYEFADVTDRSKTIVEFHVALVNDVLSFVKMSDRWYRARYELNIVFYNKKKEVVSFQSARDTVSVQDFHSTNSRRGPIYHKFVFTLAPDDYQYKIELQDLDAPKNMDRLIPLKVMDFTKPSLQISDVVLADRLSCSSGLLHDFTPTSLYLFLQPRFRAVITDRSGFNDVIGILQFPHDSFLHFFSTFYLDNFNTVRRFYSHGTGNKCDIGASVPGSFCHGVSHLSRTGIGDETDRIHELPGGTRSDKDLLAGKVVIRAENSP